MTQDAIMVASDGSFDNPSSIMGKWVSEGYPKIFFPIAGEYCFQLKVKDSEGTESGPSYDCPNCPEFAEACIDVAPKEKINIELLWDRGDDIDLDLFLVKYRDNAVFGVLDPEDPVRIIDDSDGWGPEIISVVDPDPERYRVVVKFTADERGVVSDANPNSSVTEYVKIYMDGGLTKTIMHDFQQVDTFWKVADIESRGEGNRKVTQLCAGWTGTACNNDATCLAMYGDSFKCNGRSWGKFCSICTTGSGPPNECNPTIRCDADNDCAGEATSKICAEITGNDCRCENLQEYGPYANPFIFEFNNGILDPNDPNFPYSIWCDRPEDRINPELTCTEIYGQ